MATGIVITAADQVASNEEIGGATYEQLQNDPGTSVAEAQYSRLNHTTRGRPAAPTNRQASNQVAFHQVINDSAYEEL